VDAAKPLKGVWGFRRRREATVHVVIVDPPPMRIFAVSIASLSHSRVGQGWGCQLVWVARLLMVCVVSALQSTDETWGRSSQTRWSLCTLLSDRLLLRSNNQVRGVQEGKSGGLVLAWHKFGRGGRLQWPAAFSMVLRTATWHCVPLSFFLSRVNMFAGSRVALQSRQANEHVGEPMEAYTFNCARLCHLTGTPAQEKEPPKSGCGCTIS
jgi:hypothetical protein